MIIHIGFSICLEYNIVATEWVCTWLNHWSNEKKKTPKGIHFCTGPKFHICTHVSILFIFHSITILYNLDFGNLKCHCMFC